MQVPNGITIISHFSLEIAASGHANFIIVIWPRTLYHTAEQRKSMASTVYTLLHVHTHAYIRPYNL